jgi:hypothetical protein
LKLIKTFTELYSVKFQLDEHHHKISNSDNWEWFFCRLHQAIGSPPGLVISTDAGKGIDSAVTKVFKNSVKHRECMRLGCKLPKAISG